MKASTMRRRYLTEAAMRLLIARLLLRFAPPARVFAWANRPPRRVRRFTIEEADWISWAVETVAAKRWIGGHSLPRALAIHSMLRRRGIASRLCLGVAHVQDELVADAWVEIGKNRIVGRV